jgi:hypothetical protein
LEDRRKVGESSCNFGDGTDEKVQSLMFMVMMMMMMMMLHVDHNYRIVAKHTVSRQNGLRKSSPVNKKCTDDVFENDIQAHVTMQVAVSLSVLGPKSTAPPPPPGC